MRTNHFKLASLICLCSLSISCNSDSAGAFEATECSFLEYELSVVDSFGVEFGDSLNMIGSINGYCVHPEGSIVLLDATSMKLRIISETGEAECYGSSGEGPGEFGYPQSMCVMPDGRILVSDYYKCLLMEYNISGQYLGNYLESECKIPGDFSPIDSNSVVGVVFDVVFSDDEIEGFNYYIGRFDSSPEPSVRYIEILSDYSDMSQYTKIDILDFCVDPNGLVYIVSDYTNYDIDIFSSEGIAQYRISPAVDRLEKTDEEIASEISEFEESHIWDQAYTGGYQPSPYHRLIALAGVDADRNLWVQRMDIEDKFCFDVWSLNGELIHRVSLEKYTSNPDLTFRVDQYGMLGAISESDVYPRVYKFELLEQR